MKAVVDRIEGEQAVILVKSKDLPKEALEGSVLEVKLAFLPGETRKRRTRAQNILDQIFKDVSDSR